MVRTERVDVGGLTLAVRVWPSSDGTVSPPLVLLHGTGMTARDWDAVGPALAVGREVRAVDLRGHGESNRPGTYSIALMAQDVVALLDLAHEPQVDLVGHSLGGLVALRVAAARPERVRRLVLEDVGLPRPRTPAPPARPEGDIYFDWDVVEQVRPEVDDPAPDWPDVVAGLAMPVLVVAGGPASHVPQDGIADLVAAARDGRCVTVDAGHLVHATEPERFLEAVEDFLSA
ncbi:alpha/beta fold hydrolase [Oryzobacter telluris]|uniref:alpha/beta fold hydrolase n=1 Tax=Oryzobacter telluris TaxID=3149179 RepID=UPI00370D0CE2